MGIADSVAVYVEETMNDQRGLFDDQESRFQKYQEENPHVYAAFKRFTLELVAAGRTRIGGRVIVERLRWESMVRSNTGQWKLNDHWTPFFVRLFIKEHPQHEGLFSLRKAKADTEL